MAERMLEYSFRSLRPSQTVQFPFRRRTEDDMGGICDKTSHCNRCTQNLQRLCCFCPYDGEVGVVCGFGEAKFLLLFRRHALQHTVEDVIVPLILGLRKDTALVIREQKKVS